MCTAVTYKTKDFYFGRTLDNDVSYREEVVVTPRKYEFPFSCMGDMHGHYAMIGMAHVEDGVPLYYDAVNEKGLGMAGLNFVGNAWYGPEQEGKENIATFALIPWILSQCAGIQEARALLQNINITDLSFYGKLPPAQLHWMLADSRGALVVEAMRDGLHVYDNPSGVLTNNPPFQEQMFCLNNYMHLSPRQPENLFSSQLDLHTYCRGMGALGLPGDLSSQSRFVRAAFVKINSCSGTSEEESVSQFFHILGAVDQQKGCSQVGEGKYETTIYTSCCNASKGIYYYTTYGNHQITAVDMHRESLDGRCVKRYPLIQGEQIYRQN